MTDSARSTLGSTFRSTLTSGRGVKINDLQWIKERQDRRRSLVNPIDSIGFKLVRPVRFELTAFCSGGKRSIQAELRAHVGKN